MRAKWKRITLKVAAGTAAFLLMAAGGGLLKTEASESGQTAVYGIGSTSKAVTAAAVMMLAEEGKVDLDQPLITYIPEFEMADSRYRQITPRMLLNHSSGLQGSTLNNAMLMGDVDTDNHDRLLERLKGQRLKADPGDFSVYCNDGFSLAELLVERVTGQTYTQYLEQELSSPLGLENFMTPESNGLLDRLAPVYDNRTGKELPAEMANVIGSGGMYATAEDLCRLSGIFMDGQTKKGEFLSSGSRKEMEASTYDNQVNPRREDTTLSYGLGWDSVRTYPFNRYDIKALVKGGDTTYYHSSLTVLPEENISCAVLASGGSSMECQLAVQEILMAYLEETGRIDRQEEISLKEGKEPAADAMPPELTSYSGYYTGSDMLKAEIGTDGRLTLTTMGTGHDKTQVYLYHPDGAFYSTDGDYIGMSGELLRGSGGQIGKSSLRFETDKKGRIYLMAGIYETYPGLGSTANYLPAAEKLSESAADSADFSSKDISGKEYYLVNEKYTSAFYISRFMVKPRILTEPSSYLVFEDSALKMAKMAAPNEALFFQQIPGQTGRDLGDYRFERKDGKLYLDTGSLRYVSEDGMGKLNDGDRTVTIGKEGETIWYSFDGAKEYGRAAIDVPEHGAYYIIDGTGKSKQYGGSSWASEKDVPFLLPDSGKIAFAGEPGETFEIRFSR